MERTIIGRDGKEIRAVIMRGQWEHLDDTHVYLQIDRPAVSHGGRVDAIRAFTPDDGDPMKRAEAILNAMSDVQALDDAKEMIDMFHSKVDIDEGKNEEPATT